jgi:hypothetical protein
LDGEDHGAGLDEFPRLRVPGAVETPLRFGEGNRQFGMLCEPEGCRSDLAVVITAGGRDPHCGWARSAVALARAFSASGIASLRIDFSGLGDSIGPLNGDKAFSPVFETDRSGDISAALGKLEDLGYRRFAVRGHCASAYHAFHAAMVEPRISTLVLLNMPVLASSTTEDVDLVSRKALTLGHYVRKLARAETWTRMVQGKMTLRLFLRARLAVVAEWFHNESASEDDGPGSAASASQCVKALSRRGVRSLFLFTEDDIGMKVFHRELGRRHFEGTRLVVIPGDDHAIARSETQRLVAQVMTDFLLQREVEPAPQGSPAACEATPVLSS